MRHVPWGLPEGGAGEGGCILNQREFVTGYSNYLHVPLWVAYRLDGKVRLNKPLFWGEVFVALDNQEINLIFSKV